LCSRDNSMADASGRGSQGQLTMGVREYTMLAVVPADECGFGLP
jgi:hypothetical protein